MQGLNKHIFTTTDFDTASIAPLLFVAHKMGDPGDFAGRVFRDASQVAEFRVLVAKGEAGSTQVDFDLENMPVYVGPYMVQQPSQESAPRQGILPPEIREGGGLLFFVSSGPGGYHVIIEERKELKSAKPVFDSRHLSEDDIAVVMPIRPGIYQAKNRGTTGNALITVSYPKKSNGPMKGTEPKKVKCLSGGFDPPALVIQPGDAVSFEFSMSDSRLTLELVRKFDSERDEPST